MPKLLLSIVAAGVICRVLLVHQLTVALADHYRLEHELPAADAVEAELAALVGGR